MTGCIKCGRDCQGRWCQLCAVEETAPDYTSDDDDDAECPDCGGSTSFDGVTCAECRRSDDEAEPLRADGGSQYRLAFLTAGELETLDDDPVLTRRDFWR